MPQEQPQYYRAVPVSEKPKPGWITAITKEGKQVPYHYTGSDMSFITLRGQYTHYLEPIHIPDAERLRDALEKITVTELNYDCWHIAREALSAVGDGCRADRPKVICYCGSIRIALEAFKKAEYDCLMRGDIALLPCCMFVDIEREYGANSRYKVMADEQHKCKIDMCDEVFVLNVGGYIGESTRREIEYATIIGKPIVYLEPHP